MENLSKKKFEAVTSQFITIYFRTELILKFKSRRKAKRSASKIK